MRSIAPHRSLTLAALFLLLGSAAGHAQRTQGAVAGRILSSTSGQPVAGADVAIEGTVLRVTSDVHGDFVLRMSAARRVALRVLHRGFVPWRDSVDVASGDAAAITIRLVPSADQRAPAVTTVAGPTPRVELPSDVGEIDAETLVPTRAIANMGDLLTARVPGMYVLPGTESGAGFQTRIRGVNSLSGSNEPLFIVDGVRVESAVGAALLSAGGSLPNRINDLNPEEIASVEVLRGPASAALLEEGSANGVVLITTKRGDTGGPRWSYYTEQTALSDRNDYPASWAGWSTGSLLCGLYELSAGACAHQDSVTHFDALTDPSTSPFALGYRQQHGLNLRGRTSTVGYFVSGEWEHEDGVTRMPDVVQRDLASRGVTVPDDWRDPNALKRVSGRANLDVALPWNATLALSGGHVSLDQRYELEAAAGYGIVAEGELGPGYSTGVDAGGVPLRGYDVAPGQLFERTTSQSVGRWTSSATLTLPLRSWLALRATYGADELSQSELQRCPGSLQLCYAVQHASGSATGAVRTEEVAATTSVALAPAIGSTTTIGVQRHSTTGDGGSIDSLFLAGSSSSDWSSVQFRSTYRNTGTYVDERLAFADRIFVTAGVRGDHTTGESGTRFSPRVGAAWLVRDEASAPGLFALGELRLRAAFGRTYQPYAPGTAPGSISAGSYEGYIESPLSLQRERVTETEGGFDAGFGDGRTRLELTVYQRRTDGLIGEDFNMGPRGGTFGPLPLLGNIGAVSNRGLEGALTVRVVDGFRISWEVGVSGSANRNRLESLEGPELFTLFTGIENVAQERPGYPLNGYWGRRLQHWSDANGDGRIEPSEVVLGDTAEFLGSPTPVRELVLTNGLSLAGGRVHLDLLIDYKGGFKLLDYSDAIQCRIEVCRGAIDPTAPLDEQARTVASLSTYGTLGPFVEDGDFIRLREIGATFTLPEGWASRIAPSGRLSATVAVRNLGVLWTRYGGTDPETNLSTQDLPSEAFGTAPPTYFTFKLNVGF